MGLCKSSQQKSVTEFTVPHSWSSLFSHIRLNLLCYIISSVYCTTLLAQFIVPHYWLVCATLAQFIVHYCYSLLCHIIGSVCCTLLLQFIVPRYWFSLPDRFDG